MSELRNTMKTEKESLQEELVSTRKEAETNKKVYSTLFDEKRETEKQLNDLEVQKREALQKANSELH